MYVKNDNVRDPRYFSNSFRALVKQGIDRQNRTIKMSKQEPFTFADELSGNVCDTIVVSENRFRPLGIGVFTKEIYAESSGRVPPNTYLRAIACLKDLELGANCSVIRWVDAERQLTVRTGCVLGMNASSGERAAGSPRAAPSAACMRRRSSSAPKSRTSCAIPWI